MKTQSQDITAPNLRFPEYNEQWREKRLGDICFFLKGNGISKEDISDDGAYKCIRYGELYTTYSEVIKNIKSKTNVVNSATIRSLKDDLLIPSSGETALDIAKTSCLKIPDVLLGGDINILRVNDYCGEYIAYYLTNYKKKDIAKLAQGNAVVHLYSSHLKLLKVKHPGLSEQQKIASFLSSIDDWIENLRLQKELLEKYKKGMMQKIFSQKIRFKDDDGRDFPNWEEKKIGEVTLNFSNRNGNLIDAKVYSVTNTNGFVIQTDHFDKVVAGNDLTGYKIIKKNDFAYNPARINVGSIAHFKEDIGIISSLYVCFRTSDKLTDDFLVYLLQLPRTKHMIRSYGEGGVRIYLWYDLFAKIKISLPSIKEQQKITNFLMLLDEMITFKVKRIENMEQWKKGLMQKLFI